ncbi:hypothetical protein NPIL_238541 [Nephila pilipes]|uniref:Uncharacterized protein n=1 Tax=Nephila pilipes TaxID=299642 RepID=A0A8X6TSU8_NEPPI|nr:hypothetical protein NPIL_238541 [Nephila pilipes]
MLAQVYFIDENLLNDDNGPVSERGGNRIAQGQYVHSQHYPQTLDIFSDAALKIEANNTERDALTLLFVFATVRVTKGENARLTCFYDIPTLNQPVFK